MSTNRFSELKRPYLTDTLALIILGYATSIIAIVTGSIIALAIHFEQHQLIPFVIIAAGSLMEIITLMLMFTSKAEPEN